MSLPFVPVVIIGAARSGTNMLRDMMAEMPDFATWPCDEINPIWRHGNLGWPDDEIPARRAERGRACIRRAFARMWRQSGRCRFIVEKTCANSLRVPFVRAALPEARLVQIVRNGRHATASAKRCWRRGRQDLPPGYTLSKARYVPPGDLPFHAAEYAARRLPAWLGRQRRLASWGPRFDGLDRLAGRPLEEICARQWSACVDRSDTALAGMPHHAWLRVHYEDVVAEPVRNLERITDFLGAGRVGRAALAGAASIAVPGAGRPVTMGRAAERILKPALVRHGYAG